MHARLVGRLARSRMLDGLMVMLFLSLLSFMFVGIGEARAAVARVSVVLDEDRTHALGTTREIGVLEDRRLTHTWSEAESTAWLKGLRPGVDVVWTKPHTRAVVLNISAPGMDDTLRAGVLGTDGMVRTWAPLVADARAQCQYSWNMKDDCGKRVEPGLYSIYLRRRNVGKILYIVVP